MVMGVIILFAIVLGLLGWRIILVDRRNEEYWKYEIILGQIEILIDANNAGNLAYEKILNKLKRTEWKYFKDDANGLRRLVKMNLDYINKLKK